MDLHAKTVDSGNVYIYTGFGKIPLEPPTIPLSGHTRYLTQLWVSGKEVPHEELHQSDSSQPENIGFRPGAESIVPSYQKTEDKIKSALKQLSFREQCVLVQFWSPDPTGKHQFLTTRDQPFGLGVIDDQGLCSYRKYSEHNPFFIDKDHQEYNLSPPLRVFMQGLPEWSSDLTNYSPEDFPLQDFAIRCNFHGYLALPVFDSTTRLCVGVLELLMSSKHTSYDYEVQQVHSVLKKENLTSLGTFGCSTSMVSDVRRKNEMDKIFDALKIVCSIHRVPLAQTWAASPSASFVSREQAIWKSCDSFHTRCFGKVCLSTADLPFHVQDLGVWSFREASIVCHLESSRGVAGRAFSTKDSYYCADVTKLSREEYPLVQNACISKLTGCFAIFLQNVESNNCYVLEFFLPRHVEGSRCVLNVVQTLKENLNSGFEFGDKSLDQAVGPPTDLSVHIKPDIIQTSSNLMADNFMFCSSCSEPSVTYIAGTDSANVASFKHMSMDNSFANFTDVVEQKDHLKEDRKRKRDSRVVLPVTRKVKVKVTFRKIRKKFQFRISSGLSNLKNKVAKRFKLASNMITLKYRDNENDLILIYDDADVVAALRDSRSNDTINLTCVKIKESF